METTTQTKKQAPRKAEGEKDARFEKVQTDEKGEA
jgi:hypothetical protein